MYFKQWRQCTYYVTLRRLRETIVVVESNKHYIFLSVCVCVCVCARARAGECVCPGAWACACESAGVALLIQHATRMRHVLFSFVSSLAPPCFWRLSYKLHNFRKKLLNIKCVFSSPPQLLSRIFFILRRIKGDSVIKLKTSLCKVPVIFPISYGNLKLLFRFPKKAQIINFIKILAVEAEWFYADGRANRRIDVSDEANSCYSQFL